MARARIAVAHHMWRLGGETKFSLDLIKALCRLGYEVEADSVFPISEEIAREFPPCVVGVEYLVPLKLNYAALASRALVPLLLLRAIRKGLDVMWVDSNTYRIVSEELRGAGTSIIEYIHFPLELVDPKTRSRLGEPFRSELSTYFSRYGSVRMGIYSSLASIPIKLLASRNPFETADAVLTNSLYIALVVEHLWGRRPSVLNPPVNVEEFREVSRTPRQGRDSAVVVLGRITPEKRHADVIRALALTQTRPRLRIVGSLQPGSEAYLRELNKLAKQLDVNIEIHTNVSRYELIQLLGKSSVYVHPTIGEHFGIAVVEGMAAGLPVIVHRSGGPYYDIVARGEYGLHYGDIGELSAAIDELMTDADLWDSFHRKSLMRAAHYSFSSFTDRLSKILESVVSQS